MIYFSADTHFNHTNTLRREKRPFETKEEFDRYVINTWNSQVKKEDTIYVLGDFLNFNFEKGDSDSWIKSIYYPKKIKCDVVLIIGNNEERLIKKVFKGNFNLFKEFAINAGFKDVKREDFLEYNGYLFFLNHFPSKHKDNFINLFGHVHRSTGIYKPFGINVGCDLNYFKLYSIDEILDILQQKSIFWDDDIDVNA